MSESEAAAQTRLRRAVDEIMSLNLDDLDVSEIERRLQILETLRKAGLMRHCTQLDCGSFKCGAFDE